MANESENVEVCWQWLAQKQQVSEIIQNYYEQVNLLDDQRVRFDSYKGDIYLFFTFS